MKQNQITKRGLLFSEDGNLNQRGWATAPLLTYNRECLSAPWFRTKEWEFYGAYDKDFGVEVFIADIGYFTLLGMVYHDFVSGKAHKWGGVKPLTRGKLGLSTNPEHGKIEVNNFMAGCIALDKQADKHHLVIDSPGFKGLKLDLVYPMNPADDAMVVATGYENSKHFYYNYKKNMLAVTGEVSFAGQTRSFTEHATGNFDWGRGVWPYKTRWFWGTGAGKIGNEKVWFNIGYGFGDLSTHTENMIFVDGKVHKTAGITFHTEDRFSGKPWHFTSDDHRINLRLEPKTDCSGKFNVGFLKTDINQIHGLYYGTLILDDGREIEVDGIHGHAEDISYRW